MLTLKFTKHQTALSLLKLEIAKLKHATSISRAIPLFGSIEARRETNWMTHVIG